MADYQVTKICNRLELIAGVMLAHWLLQAVQWVFP